MDSRLKNRTLDVYRGIFTVVIVLYIVIIQIVIACTSGDLLNDILLSLFNSDSVFYDFFKQNTVSAFVNIVLFGSGYVVLFLVVNFIYSQFWVKRNRDCYLAGRWYHIHTRENDPSYIRCGIVEIRQNYFDINVTASNFEPLSISTDWKIETSSHNITYWGYNIADLSEVGNIVAGYTTNKVTGSTRTNKGLHQLRVIDHDIRGYPSVMGGTFSDIYPSTSEGHIRIYREYPVSNLFFRLLYFIKYGCINSRKEFKKLSQKTVVHSIMPDEINSYDTVLSQGPITWKKTLKILLDKKHIVNDETNQTIITTNTTDVILDKMISIVRSVGKSILDASESSIDTYEKTSHRDIFTTYDVNIQNKLVSELKQLISDAEFIAEESNWDKNDKLPDGYCFIIDPIDGTSNFSRNYKHSCVSVGLSKNGMIISGVVHDPYLDETFYASKGCGAYINGKKLSCSNRLLKDSIVGFGTAPYNIELSHETFAFSEMLFNKSNDLRRSGSSALDICYVAAGRLDLFYELSLYPWDYAASSLIASEAGAIITDMDQKQLSFTKKCSVAVGGQFAYNEFMVVYESFKTKK